MNLASTSDHDLLRRMESGDRDAFAVLYRRRQAGIFRFALHMCGSEHVAEDVTQDVFLTLIRAPHTYDAGRGSVAAFLYGIAKNQVLRRLGREQQFDEDEDEPAAACHLEDEMARAETVESVRAAVLALPLHYREAVVLCDLQEMDYTEAAAALGCAVGTVRSRLHRARRMLAKRLQAGCRI